MNERLNLDITAEGTVIAGNEVGRDLIVQLPPAAEPGPRIAARAVLEGPVRTLRLAETVQKANDLSKAGQWREAADLFESVAATLEANHYVPVAEGYRGQRATVLLKAGDVDEGAKKLMALSWRAVLDRFAPQSALRWGVDVANATDSMSADVRASWEFVHLAAAGFDEPEDIGDHLAERIVHLSPDAPFLLEAAVFTAEWFVTFRLSAPPQHVIERLREIENSHNDHDLELRLRLAMCLAEFDSNWNPLYVLVADSQRLRAWARAREARAAVMHEPQRAATLYNEALEDGVESQLWDEVKSWFYSADQASRWSSFFPYYGVTGRDRVLQSFVATSPELSLVPRIADLELNARARHSEANLSTLSALRAWLWCSVVGASLTKEIAACSQLGEFFANADRSYEAVRWTCRSGDQKRVKRIGSKLPETSLLLLPDDPFMATSHGRVMGFIAVSHCADMLPDELASDWFGSALKVLSYRGECQHPYAKWEAIKTMAVLAETSTEQMASEAVGTIAQILNSLEDGKSVPEARSFASTLIGIARRHESLFEAAMRQAIQHVIRNRDFGSTLVMRAADLLSRCSELVLDILGDAQTHWPDILGLVIIAAAGENAGPRGKESAEKFHQTLLNWRPPSGGAISYGTNYWELPQVAVPMTPLQRQEIAAILIGQAECQAEAAVNRRSALHALVSLSAYVEDLTIRRQLFERSLAIASGKFEGSADDDHILKFSDPLGRFRINGASTSINGSAVIAAARFAKNEADFEQTRDVALQLLETETESEVLVDIARTLANLPEGVLDEQLVSYLAIDSRKQIRAAAAILLARSTPLDIVRVSRLSKDISVMVRQNLAFSIRSRDDLESADVAGLLRDFLADTHRSVRRAALPE